MHFIPVSRGRGAAEAFAGKKSSMTGGNARAELRCSSVGSVGRLDEKDMQAARPVYSDLQNLLHVGGARRPRYQIHRAGR